MKIKRVLKKVFLHLLTGLVVLVMITVGVFFFWLGPAVKLAAEKVGSKALGVPITMNTLKISPRYGTLLLEGFSVGNHAGYAHSNTVSLTKLAVSVDMRSMLSDTIIVEEILIDRPHLVYEQQTAGDNIEQFMTNIFAFAGIDPNALDQTKAEPKPAKDTPAKQVVIHHLRLTDLKMTLASTETPLLDMTAGLEELNLSLTNGVIHLSKLSISNPRRLKTTDIFSIDSIAVKLDPSSLYSGTVIVEDVKISKPYVYLEKTPDTDTTSELMKIANRLAAKTKPAAPGAAPVVENNDPEPGPPPVKLQHLLVDDIQLKLFDSTPTNGPARLQTIASVEKVSVKLTEGDLQVESIVIPNPDTTFTSTNLFHLAEINITLDPATLHSRQIVINDVLVNTPIINLEQTETTGNVTELQKLLLSFIPPPGTSLEPQSDQTGSETSTQPVPLAEQPVILETLRIEHLAINMITPVKTNSLPGLAQLGQLNPMNKLSLNPMQILAGSDTNDTAEIEGGPLTLITFDQLLVEPLEGIVTITNLMVGNPKGFANKNIVQLDQFILDLDPDTLQSEVVQIEAILIDNPTIAYERKLSTDNIKALQQFIENVTQQRKEQKENIASSQETATVPDKEKQKIMIEHVRVTSGLVKAKLSALPSAPVVLPKIEMTDIGKESGGTTVRQAVQTIGTTLLDSMFSAIAGTSGFAVDALKGVGQLVPGIPSAAEDEKDPVVKAEPETPPPEAEVKRRPRKKRRRIPGRY